MVPGCVIALRDCSNRVRLYLFNAMLTFETVFNCKCSVFIFIVKLIKTVSSNLCSSQRYSFCALLLIFIVESSCNLMMWHICHIQMVYLVFTNKRHLTVLKFVHVFVYLFNITFLVLIWYYSFPVNSVISSPVHWIRSKLQIVYISFIIVQIGMCKDRCAQIPPRRSISYVII